MLGPLRNNSIALARRQPLLALPLDRARTRVQFGRPIAARSAIQAMLADTVTDLALVACEALGRAAERAVQIHGGTGFMKDCPSSTSTARATSRC